MICPVCAMPHMRAQTVCTGCGVICPAEEVLRKMRAVLALEDHPEIRFFVRDRAVIGRTSSGSGPVDIDLKGIPGAEYVSRRHAEIYVDDGTFWVRDLHSTNGTFVEDEGPIRRPRPLKHGMRVRFASLTFRFLLEGEDE